MAKRYWINYLREYIFTPAAPANDTTSQTGTFKAMVERIQNRMTQSKGVPWYQDAPTTLSTTATHIAEDASTAHGGSIQATQKDGTAQTFRPTYNFTGPGVTVSDDSVNSRTNIDIPGGAGGGGGGSAHVIQEEGATLTARSRLNFRGVGSTATDDSGNDRTNVDIRGNVARSGTAPTSPVAGELWLDTTTSPATLREYDGGTWNATSGTPRDASVTDIKVASGAAIAKSKLANLAVDTADLATNRSLLITCTSLSRPSNPLTGQAIFETDTQLVRVNTGTPGAPVWTSITASQTYQSPGFINGLALTWDAGNTLGIEPGAAYIEGTSVVVPVTTRMTRAVSFAASSTTWYHVYLFDNGGSPDIEISTDAPATPYFGSARSRGGAAPSTSRRFIGSILPNGAATPAMRKFHHIAHTNRVHWLENLRAAPFTVLNGGASSSEATVNCAPVVPPTSRAGTIVVENLGSTAVFLGSPDDNFTLGGATGLSYVNVGNQVTYDAFQLSSSQTFTYAYTTTGGALYVGVQGYYYER